MLEEEINNEVKAFLSGFQAWISGRGDVDWDAMMAPRLDLDGTYVSRKGIVQTLGELSEEVRQAHASNTGYRVKPGAVRIIDSHAGRHVVL